MIETHDNLYLISLNPEQNKRCQGYWYLVTSGHMAHNFYTRAGLGRWLDERGVSLTAPLPEHGTWSVQPLQGSYRTDEMLESADLYGHEFDESLAAPHTLAAWRAVGRTCVVLTFTLSNGEYTEARITLDEDGIRTVHHLNPNVQARIVYPYESTRSLLGQ
jgi:hypothetical protein